MKDYGSDKWLFALFFCDKEAELLADGLTQSGKKNIGWGQKNCWQGSEFSL